MQTAHVAVQQVHLMRMAQSGRGQVEQVVLMLVLVVVLVRRHGRLVHLVHGRMAEKRRVVSAQTAAQTAAQAAGAHQMRLQLVQVGGRQRRQTQRRTERAGRQMAVRAGRGRRPRAVHDGHERVGREADHRAQVERVRVRRAGQGALATLSDGRSRTG